MLRKVIALVFCAAAGALAAQGSIAFAVADVPDTGANLATADVQVSVTPASQWWTVGGISNIASGLAPLAPGVTLHVQYDPDDPTTPVMTAPGGAGEPGNPATFVSLPRDQFSAKRFGSNGAATIAGGYDPPLPDAALNDTQINIAFLQFPPSIDGSDVPDIGYIARVTIDTSASVLAGVEVYTSTTGPRAPDDVLLGEFRILAGERNGPPPLPTITFGFYAVPEPESVTLLALGALSACRRARLHRALT